MEPENQIGGNAPIPGGGNPTDTGQETNPMSMGTGMMPTPEQGFDPMMGHKHDVAIGTGTRPDGWKQG